MSFKNRQLIIGAAAIIALGLIFFHEMLGPEAIRFSTDDNIGQIALVRSYLPRAFLGFWNDSSLVGSPELLPVSLTFMLRWLMPPRISTNWLHAVHLSLASFFLILYLRNKGLRTVSCLMGILAAFWLASNFTLVYPGHTSKFGILAFSAAFLWLADRAARTRDPAWSVLAGGALGATFVEQPDVAFFFALILGPYALFEAWRNRGADLKAQWKFLVPLFVVAALLAVSPMWVGYKIAVRGVSTMTEETPAEKWNYCTQWSWPPEESIDFIAPGYFGWRSGDEEGPYWGRMGRSAGWKTTGQGFQNFKLENQYIGAIPVILALFALFAAFAKSGILLSKSPVEWRSQIIFWGAVALLTLLLSFGKHFPLYSLFFKLPIVSSIRNPNKFLQVFQLALALLAAYGFDITARTTQAAYGTEENHDQNVKTKTGPAAR